MAAQLEVRWVTPNTLPVEARSTLRQPTSFAREGEKHTTKWEALDTSSLNVAPDWEMQTDLRQKLKCKSDCFYVLDYNVATVFA